MTQHSFQDEVEEQLILARIFLQWMGENREEVERFFLFYDFVAAMRENGARSFLVQDLGDK